MSAHAFTLYDMLSRNALIYGDRPAVIQAQGRLTFRDFLARVNALATGLAVLPLVKGERLCILAQNHPAYLELYGACARLGVIAYPINWRLTAEEIARIVERAAPRLLLVGETTSITQATPDLLGLGRTSASRNRRRLGWKGFGRVGCSLMSSIGRFSSRGLSKLAIGWHIAM